jgi:hypothetical protein
MLLLEDVDGASPPKELVVRATIDPNARRALLKLVASAADGLHAFQRLKVRGLLPRGPDILMKKLAKDSESPEQLAQVAPDLAELIRTSVVRLTSEAARMAPESVRLGHGSFRHTHFLLRSDRPVLVDLEGLCLRGVSADAGDFLAYLDWVGCRQPQYGSLLEECSAIFLMGLKGLPDLSPHWLSWHRAAAQVKWALRTFASLAPSWVEISERLVRLSGQALPMPCSRAGISGARASAPGARRRKIAARRLIP